MDVSKLWGPCTNAAHYGCVRDGHNGLLPPIMSAKLKTKGKHSIRYGKVEVRAKIPKGDWLWPAIWMMPEESHYGVWPRSGEIDMMESRGNTVARDSSNHGANEMGATLHWGPAANQDGYSKTHGSKNNPSLWSSDFHDYVLDWTADHIIASVDNVPYMTVKTPSQGFFAYGGFKGTNPWAHGGKNAPFDQPFYLILNVAVGGENGYFPDTWHYDTAKPWKNTSPHENKDFWDKRNSWLPTWKGDDAAMQIDSVTMTQY